MHNIVRYQSSFLLVRPQADLHNNTLHVDVLYQRYDTSLYGI